MADVFFDLAGNFHNSPTAFAFIRDKIFNANYRLFVDMVGDIFLVMRFAGFEDDGFLLKAKIITILSAANRFFVSIPSDFSSNLIRLSNSHVFERNRYPVTAI